MLDPRFAAILSQNEVAVDQMEALAKAGVKTTALYGHIARNEDKLELFLKRVLGLDADVKPEDCIPIARLVIVWETCRKRLEVETEAAAQRVVNHLPPPLTIEDHASAREAFAKLMGRRIAEHKIPSENSSSGSWGR